MTSPRLQAALRGAVAEGERNLQVAACLHGDLIVEAAIGRPDAVFPVFSVGKGVVALAIAVQASRGLLDLDAPIADVWPQYGAAGKRGITVRQVLCHRAGVPQLPANLTPADLADWDSIVDGLASLTPLYEPGAVNAYHSYSFGWILGELVRRTDVQGRSFAAFVREELCEPLRADAFWFGVPRDVERRVATLDYPDPPPEPAADAPVHRAVPPALALGPTVYNQAAVHRASIPATGAIADARSLARLFAVWAGNGAVGDVRLLEPGAVRACLTPRPGSGQPDLTYGMPLPVGVGGLWIEAPGVAPGRTVLAHPGAGSSIAWAELGLGLSVAICHDRMTARPGPSFLAIANAVRAIANALD